MTANADVARRAMEAKTLLTPEESGKKGGRGNKGDDNYQALSDKGGTDPDYLTARIARDCPEVHEAMMFTVAHFRRRTGALSCTYRNA